MTERKIPLPLCYLVHRRAGEHHWSGPISFFGAVTVREARERSRHLVEHGFDGCVKGKLHDFRFYRGGVCVDAWQESGR